MTDFRALCAELHAAFNTYAVDEAHHDLLVRAARRLKQPSLKEQSLALIDKIQGNKEMWNVRDLDVVRQALEQLE